MAADRLVSAVVPVFNGKRFLVEALASIAAQTYAPVEVILVDDGSTDGSADLVVGFPAVQVLRQTNRGVAAARNAGVAASRGELIAFLDQDDRWTADKLALQVRRMTQRRDLAFTLAHQRLFLEPGAVRPGWLRPEHLEVEQIGYLPGTLVAWRRTFERVGAFEEADPIASDTDWFLRAADAGLGMEIMPEVLLERRIHATNQSALTDLGHAELLRAVRRSVARKQVAGRGREDAL